MKISLFLVYHMSKYLVFKQDVDSLVSTVEMTP